jgi:hypothetical protein
MIIFQFAQENVPLMSSVKDYSRIHKLKGSPIQHGNSDITSRSVHSPTLLKWRKRKLRSNKTNLIKIAMDSTAR